MSYSVAVSVEDLKFSADLQHMEQVERYRIAFNKLVQSENDAKKTKDEAKKVKNAQLHLEAELELDRITVLWTPFIFGASKAQKLKDDGYLLADPQGNLTPAAEGYEADAIVSLFLIILEAVVADYIEKFGQETQKLLDGKVSMDDYAEALVQLTPGLRILQDFRNQIIPTDDTGEIANWIRNPIKRPMEIVQNIRDEIISPDDNGELAKIFRDPIKRPVEVIKKIGKKIFGW